MNLNGSSATSPTGPSNPDGDKVRGSASSHSPAHTGLGLSSSAGSSRSSSSFSSQKSKRNRKTHLRPSNESTPIFSGVGASTRNYQTTEAPAGPYGLKCQPKDNQTAPSNGVTRTDSDAQTQQSNQPETPTEPRQAWYKRLLDRYGGLELENKGSVARDHLALERTFLAWMRTSLAFASIGIAVTQLFRLNTATASTDSYNTLHSPNTHPAILPPTHAHTLLDIATTSSSADLSRLRSVGKPLGTTFIGVAILILIVGFHRYFESQYWIVRGKFPASRGSVALTTFVAAALIIASFAVIVAVSPGAIET